MCPICLSASPTLFLKRLSVPVHQNLVMNDRQAAVDIQKGDLELVHCEQCGFVFNQAFNENKLSYGEQYDNTQELSSIFKEHIQTLVHHLIFEKKVQNCTVSEVGCGKGGFIKLLIEKEQFNNKGYGFDPTYLGPQSLYEGRLKFEKTFYNEEASHLPVDVVICRHVIEHIQNPLKFLQLIRKTLIHSPHARLFFETPCLKWILKNQVIWDFFYEHCSYFTADTLSSIFERAGFHVESVKHVFGGQYLWLEATLSSSTNSLPQPEKEMGSWIEKYRTAEEALKNSWKEQIQRLAKDHKLALWGAGAKGVTFANLIDPQHELIECLIDINPRKQSFFTPGTGHPIVSFEEAAKRGVNKAFVMNANYKQESLELLAQAGIAIDLI